MKTRNSIIASLAAVALLGGGNALAQAGPVRYVYAPVVDVEPIYATERVPVEREVCRHERGYRRSARRSHGGSATGTIAGAIIGGVVGNQFGSGSGKTALTAAGAALGASIGHDATRHRRRAHPVRYEHCEIQIDYEHRSYTTGYRVHYEYDGEVFQTRTRSEPGEVIRLKVSAYPVG